MSLDENPEIAFIREQDERYNRVYFTISDDDDGQVHDQTPRNAEMRLVPAREQPARVRVDQRGGRQWNDGYFLFGMRENNDEQLMRAECFICAHICTNEGSKHPQIRRHFSTKHTKDKKGYDKDTGKAYDLQGVEITPEYLQTLKDNYEARLREMAAHSLPCRGFIGDSAYNDTVLSYRLAFITVKSLKPYTDAAKFGSEFAAAMFNGIIGKDAVVRMNKVPISAKGIRTRTIRIADHITQKTADEIRRSPCPFSLQFDESTDKAGCSHVVAFVRYVFDGEVRERILLCAELEHRQTAPDIAGKIMGTIKDYKIPPEKMGTVSSDAAQVNIGVHAGVIELLKVHSPGLTSTTCLIHRYVLCLRPLPDGLKHTMKEIKDIAKYLRVSPSCKREFKVFCKSKNSSVCQVPYYNITRWLSAGGTVGRVFRIRLIIHEFLNMKEERGRELAKNFEDPVFRARLAFLSDLLPILDKANTDLQGKFLTKGQSLKVIRNLQERIRFLRRSAAKQSFIRFPRVHKAIAETEEWLQDFVADTVHKDVMDYLETIQKKLAKKFRKLRFPDKWMVDPFNAKVKEFPRNAALKKDMRTLTKSAVMKKKFESSKDCLHFWASIASTSYQDLAREAIINLLPFVTTYRCEQAFSLLKLIKADHRLITELANYMILACTQDEPNYEEIVAKYCKQFHSSHTPKKRDRETR